MSCHNPEHERGIATGVLLTCFHRQLLNHIAGFANQLHEFNSAATVMGFPISEQELYSSQGPELYGHIPVAWILIENMKRVVPTLARDHGWVLPSTEDSLTVLSAEKIIRELVDFKTLTVSSLMRERVNIKILRVKSELMERFIRDVRVALD